MLKEIEESVERLVRFDFDCPVIFREDVLVFLASQGESITKGKENNHYIEFLRSIGFGRNFKTITASSLDAWLLDDCFLDLRLFEEVLNGTLRPIFSRYQGIKRLDSDDSANVSSEANCSALESLLADHTVWMERPTFYGVLGSIEQYFILVERLISKKHPSLADELGIHYGSYLAQNGIHAGFVFQQLMNQNRMGKATQDFVAFWKGYLNSISDRLAIPISPESYSSIASFWISTIRRNAKD